MSTEAKYTVKWVLLSILIALALLVLLPTDLINSLTMGQAILNKGAGDLGYAIGYAIGQNCLGILVVGGILGGIYLLARWSPGARA